MKFLPFLVLSIMLFSANLIASPATDYTFIREFGTPGIHSNEFQDMDGIAVDRFGNVFVSDLLALKIDVGVTQTVQAVKRWTAEGIFNRSWPNAAGMWADPRGIDCSCDGNPYYIAPLGPDVSIQDIEYTTGEGMYLGRVPGPVWDNYVNYEFIDVAVSADGSVYGTVIRRPPGAAGQYVAAKFEWNGTFWNEAAIAMVTNENGLSHYVQGIDVDPRRNRVYVTIMPGKETEGRPGIKVYDMNLKHIADWLPWEYMAKPTGVGIDNRNGTFLVTESVSNRIYKYALDGTEILQFGMLGSQPYEFNRPTDLDVNMNGWLFVADSGNDKVQVYAPPREGNLNFIVYKSKIKVGWKQKIKGKDRDLILCKALAAIDVYTNITSMLGMPFSFWLNNLEIIPEMVPTKTNKKGTKALYATDKEHKAMVQYRPDGALLRLTVKHKRGNVNGPLNITDTTLLPPWLWATAQMTLSNEYLGVHYMRLAHKNKVGKVYKAWKK